MPIDITTTAGGSQYANPIIGPVQHTLIVTLDISGMTASEVDTAGYLKPGVPLDVDGDLCGGSDYVYGITFEAQKVATGNTSAILSAATDPPVTLCTHGIVNRDVVEDNLGRALTANEVTAFKTAGSNLTLTNT